MVDKKRYKKILILAVCISLCCAVYLNTQLGFEGASHSSSYIASSPDQNMFFPEVEMIKVVVEKFFDVLTLANA